MQEEVRGARLLVELLAVVSEHRMFTRWCSLLERAHGGDVVRGVARISEVLAHGPVLIVAEDAADRGGDVEEVAF